MSDFWMSFFFCQGLQNPAHFFNDANDNGRIPWYSTDSGGTEFPKPVVYYPPSHTPPEYRESGPVGPTERVLGEIILWNRFLKSSYCHTCHVLTQIYVHVLRSSVMPFNFKPFTHLRPPSDPMVVTKTLRSSSISVKGRLLGVLTVKCGHWRLLF